MKEAMSTDASPPPHESRRVSAAAVLAVPVLGIAYAVLALLNPLLSTSPVAVVLLSLLFFLSVAVVLVGPSSDPLDPFRLVSGCFAFVYCVAPLFADSYDWYVRAPVPTLLAKGAAMALLAYLSIALGFYLATPRRSFSLSTPYQRGIRREPAIALAVLLFVVGLLSFALMFTIAGGVERIIGGDESRSGFFRGIGYFYHASYFMYSGGALYFAACLGPRSGRFAWLHAWPIFLAAALFIVLQGRSAAVIGVVAFVVIAHYTIKPIRIPRASLYGAAVIVVAIFVGYARNPNVRGFLLYDPSAVVADVAENFWPLLETMFGHSLNRMKQVMLALDHFPSTEEPLRWGSTLLIALNPVLRLTGFGDALTESLGNEFMLIARPDLSPYLESGYHPSLLGEMLVNFPWYLVPIPLVLFGAGVRWIYNALIASRRDPVSTVVYGLVVFRAIDMVIVGFGQLLFGILVVSLPVLVARRFLVTSPVGEGTSSAIARAAPWSASPGERGRQTSLS